MHIPPDTIAVAPVRLNGRLYTRHPPQRLWVNVQTSPQASRASFRARSRQSTHRHADTVHRGAHSQELEPPTNATLPCQPINDPARATYRATSPSTPTQSHKQEALRSKHVKPMTSPQRIHLVIATAVHACDSCQFAKAATRARRSQIYTIFRGSASTQYARWHCPTARLAVATAKAPPASFGAPSRLRRPQRASWQAQSNRSCSRPLQVVAMPPAVSVQLLWYMPIPPWRLPSLQRQGDRLPARAGP